MTTANDPRSSTDPFDLGRFLSAQEGAYPQALSEIRQGRKRSHWMWFVFPQFEGLGHSPTARHYSIKSIEEARAYLAHPVLGARLLECAEAVASLPPNTAERTFGFPDHLKLRSSATLFAAVSPEGSVFHRVLDRHYGGEPDARTLALLPP